MFAARSPFVCACGGALYCTEYLYMLHDIVVTEYYAKAGLRKKGWLDSLPPQGVGEVELMEVGEEVKGLRGFALSGFMWRFCNKC